MGLVRDWSHLRPGIQRIADADLPGARDEPFDEDVGDIALNQDAGPGEAHLAGVGEDAE